MLILIYLIHVQYNRYKLYYYNENMVVAQAGVSLIALAYDAMKRGLSGLEWACGIPGTVGGAIFMNAGAYKSSMKEIVTEVLNTQIFVVVH